ncbi:MAG: hybrid sensor histidine kinase/response regulator [Bacilli bacterium]|nr:hybrid sensor histidine kinase/response regulator [Bacilli bacterium]
MLTIPVTIFSMIYMLLLAIVYFSKRRIPTVENKIYSKLVVLSCIGIILDAISSLFVVFSATNSYLFVVVTKMMFCYYILWSGVLLSYTVTVSLNSRKNKEINMKRIYRVISLSYLICAFLVIILPLVYHSEDGIIYPDGLSVMVTYFVAGFVSIMLMIIMLLINYTHIKSRKYIPIYSLLVLFFIAILIQQRNPQLILTTAVECFITFLMYFTIENPDVQMMEELYKNKKIIEKSSEDTSNFMFRMTQDIKRPIKDILDVSSDMYDIKDLSELMEGTKIINNKARELDYLVNDALDVSRMNTNTIKLYDTRYNVVNLFKEIKYQTEGQLSENVKFEYSISNNLPLYLYGDSIKLKQAVYSVLENSIKNTSSGYISLDVSSIIKYDICRLIINISDSGRGMNIEEVNNILSLNIDDLSKIDLSSDKKSLNLKEIKKLVTFIGDNLIVKSGEGKGTEVSITIDQKIVKLKDNEISKKIDLYEQSLYSNKRIMVVDDDAKELSKITTYLEKSDAIVSGSLFGRDVIDKLSSKHNYDLIILDDETDTSSAYEVLMELKKNPKFNIPVVIMIDDNKEFIKLHFLKDGFADVIMKSKLNSELDRILKRF